MPCAKAIRKSLIFTEVILICDKLESKEENVTPAYLTGEKKKKKHVQVVRKEIIVFLWFQGLVTVN